ncbi:XRE family transcriptional regulator [Streptomyces sp. NPDC050264]|uniref:XRE family transcriptional regulator n=1 Tax=Streptomyces sp. NPDC050264 TaxID=3155038 RepID=UPI00341F1F14
MEPEETAGETPGGAERRTDLSDLLRNRSQELKMSLRDVADATAAYGPDATYKRSTFINLVNAVPHVKAPTEAQLRALADILRYPTVALQRAAAAQFLGYVAERWIERGERARVFIAEIDELSDEELEEYEGLAQIVMRRRKIGG